MSEAIVEVEILDDQVAEAVIVEGTTTVEVEVLNPTETIVVDVQDFLEVVGNWTSVRTASIAWPFTMTGALQVKVGDGRLPIHEGTWKITSILATVKTAPGGQAILVDVNVNGTTIFDTPGDRLTIAVGQDESTVGDWDDLELTIGDYLSVDVDQVGTGGNPGDTLTVSILLERTA